MPKLVKSAMSPEETEQVVCLYVSGSSLRNLSKRFGRARRTLRSVLTSHSVTLRLPSSPSQTIQTREETPIIEIPSGSEFSDKEKRTCRICGHEKLLTEFSLRGGSESKGGGKRKHQCKLCLRERATNKRQEKKAASDKKNGGTTLQLLPLVPSPKKFPKKSQVTKPPVGSKTGLEIIGLKCRICGSEKSASHQYYLYAPDSAGNGNLVANLLKAPIPMSLEKKIAQCFVLCETCQSAILNQESRTVVSANFSHKRFGQVNLWNEDCIVGMRKRIPDSTVDLVIADPPFGIQETKFDKGFYERNPEHVLEGYVEAPEDYMKFTRDWMTEAVRSLRPGGSIYVIIGHSRLREVLTASAELGLPLINQCVYKYSFGTKTEKKYTTSHYNVLFYQKPGGVSTFNTHCRFGPSETIVEDGKRGSLLYRDLEDVFVYKRKNVAGEKKNGNCLPIELVEKLILYSSKEGDFVLDPFQGNFTTAYAARGLKRRILGFELNKVTFNLHAPQVRRVEFGGNLKNQRAPVIFVPPKRGKPFEDGEKEQMYNYFLTLRAGGVPSPQAVKTVSERHLRTTASIKRIVRDMKKNPPKISA